MDTLIVPVALGLVALALFAAKRSLSLYAWSRLESLSLPRSREKAVERCLEERELVSTAFSVTGSLALALAVALLIGEHYKDITGTLIAQVGAAILLITWVVPEILALVVRDRLVLYVVPLLYRVIGMPFRAFRALTGQSSRVGSESADGNGDSASDAVDSDAEAHEFFKDAVRLRHTPVREIMTPRTDMSSIEVDATLREAAELSRTTGKSRLPVYRENRDQIVGVLHVKDLLDHAASERWDKPGLEDICRQPYFVPETKTISELMEEFRRSNNHMGIVLDEYGGTSGVVTLEDVLEELVGEIHDEHEMAAPEEQMFKYVDGTHVEVKAVMRIEDFNDAFDCDLPDEEDFDTVGGFITFILGKIPVVGESFPYGRTRFTVLEADLRHVISVSVAFEEEVDAKELT